MASRIERDARNFAEIEVGRQAQEIGNRFVGDRRDVLCAGEAGCHQPDRAYPCGGENLSSAPSLTHEAAATGACRSRIVHGVLPRERPEGTKAPMLQGHNKATQPATTRADERRSKRVPLVSAMRGVAKDAPANIAPQIRRVSSCLRRTCSAPLNTKEEIRSWSYEQAARYQFSNADLARKLAAQFVIQVQMMSAIRQLWPRP
jgi:hypothetical protein